MAALLIGPEERIEIAELRAFAAANVIDPQRITTIAAQNGEDAVRAFMAILSIELPVGFAVTYSHEKQPFGLCQHLSVSVTRAYKLPSTAAVQMILAAFGMLPLEWSIKVWIEQIAATGKAINVVQHAPGTPGAVQAEHHHASYAEQEKPR